MAAMTLMLALMAIGTSPAGAADTDPRNDYVANCAGCHGADGRGTAWGPSIVEEGPAGADFMMRTGRMPIRTPNDPIEHREPRLTDAQISSIVSYVADLGGPPVPTPAPTNGDLRLGAELYILNCAACHGATGVGGALVGARNAPSIRSATGLEIAEAIRSGPGPMPSFDTATLDDHAIDSITRYVLQLGESESKGGWSLGRWGPVAEGAAAWLIGVVLAVGAALWIEGRRHRRSESAGA